jgi:glucosamine-6-phosphate deaminase
MVHYLDGNMLDLDEEIARDSALLKEYPPDITCAGVREKALVKIVQLTEGSRQQQVIDGCFDGIEQVPQQALTLIIPSLLTAPFFACIVPARSKAEAVRRMLTGPYHSRLPSQYSASAAHAILYLDPESAALISDYGEFA